MRAGAEVDALDEHRETPLCGAIKQKALECAEFLLDAGAKISNIRDREFPSEWMDSIITKRQNVKRSLIAFIGVLRRRLVVLNAATAPGNYIPRDMVEKISFDVWETRLDARWIYLDFVDVEVKFSDTKPGDALALVGASVDLGLWRCPLRFSGLSWPLWRLRVPHRALINLACKLVLIRANGDWVWEPIRGNRVFLPGLERLPRLVLKWGVASVLEEDLSGSSGDGVLHTHIYSGFGMSNIEVFFHHERPKKASSLFVFFDGQFVFKEHHNHLKGRGMSLFAGKVLPASCVGIAFGSNEVTRARNYNLLPHGDDLFAYSDWLVETELPRLKRMYGVDPECPIFLVGSSFGAVAALYTLSTNPSMFSGAICMSSCFRVTSVDRCLSEELDEHHRLYFDCGIEEPEVAPWTLDAEEAVKALQKKPLLRVVLNAEGGHDEESWGKRLPRAVAFCLQDIEK